LLISSLLLVIASVSAQQSQSKTGFVFDITVQNVEQLDAILKRAEKLRGNFDIGDQSRIALVLHGKELELFRKQNYAMYREIVEQARLLDQSDLIDIKACQTVMRNLHIEQSELPEFIEQVPLAPVEIERLMVKQGFTRL
jgi:intracellular sulfur oxidation DsrE/DsrF family protein